MYEIILMRGFVIPRPPATLYLTTPQSAAVSPGPSPHAADVLLPHFTCSTTGSVRLLQWHLTVCGLLALLLGLLPFYHSYRLLSSTGGWGGEALTAAGGGTGGEDLCGRRGGSSKQHSNAISPPPDANLMANCTNGKLRVHRRPLSSDGGCGLPRRLPAKGLSPDPG